MNWDSISANGKMKKGKLGGQFVSRNSPYRQSMGNKIAKAEKINRGKIDLEKTDCEIKKDKEGKVYFSGRVKGKFARLEISESLAEKLSK